MAAAALLIMSTAASAQKINGTWNGKLKAMNVEISIVMHIDANKGSCTMDSPDQNVKGIPAQLPFLSSDSVAISIPMINATYRAAMKEGKLRGVYTQNGYSIPLIMENKAIVLNRPQTPQPPFEYLTKEVEFVNKDDNAALSGTLTYPVGYDKMNHKKVPVVVLVSGSGQQDRDETLFGHKPFAVIADYFAKHGIATFRYDDRGIGKSKGDFLHATTENNLKDALAAVNTIRNMKEFGKVGLLGHSEGGMIAFMAAAQQKVGFIISMAGTGERGDKILIEQMKTAYGNTPQNQKIFEISQKCYDYYNSGKRAESVDALAKAIGEEKFLAENPAVRQNMEQFVKQLNTPWIQFFIKYDPRENIAKAKCPVMAVNGEKDRQVDVERNFEVIKKNLPKNKKNLTKRYPDLNHLFQHCHTGAITEYNQIEETISPELLKDMAEWVGSLK